MKFTPETFFFDTPLYSPVTIGADDQQELHALFKGSIRDIEGFNPIEKTDSTFEVLSQADDYLENYGGFGNIKIRCKRYNTCFHFSIVYLPSKHTLTKVGQVPSVADFHI